MSTPEHDDRDQLDVVARDRKAWNIPAPRPGPVTLTTALIAADREATDDVGEDLEPAS